MYAMLKKKSINRELIIDMLVPKDVDKLERV